MLSTVQIDQFHMDGYLMLERYFPREEMDSLLAVARGDQEMTENAYEKRDAGGRTSRLSLRSDLPDNAYSAYARHLDIVEPLEQLLREEVFHYHHKMMLKEPRVGGAWEWHQDFGYWYANFLRPDMASCMIAVDRASKENGCLQILKSSHQLGRLQHGQIGNQTGADLERVHAAVERLKLVYCEMEPGTVLFFHSNLLHRSDPNESDAARRALICCYCAASNSSFRPEYAGGQYERLERWSNAQVKNAVERHRLELQPT